MIKAGESNHSADTAKVICERSEYTPERSEYTPKHSCCHAPAFSVPASRTPAAARLHEPDACAPLCDDAGAGFPIIFQQLFTPLRKNDYFWALYQSEDRGAGTGGDR